MAEEAAFAGVVGKIAENLVTLIGQQFRYVFCYKGNIKKMKNQVDQLEVKRNAVQLSVERTINNCEVVGPDVEPWLKCVEEEKKKADLVLSDVENIGNGCLNEWCLHLKSRYWLSRKATKRTQDLVDLLAQGGRLTVAYPRPPLGKVPTSTDNNEKIPLVGVEGLGDGESKTMPDASLVTGSGIASTSTGSSGELKSRLVILENVMEAVRDVKIRTIGICGMGGVGKTTLVKEVEKRAKEEKLFDEIAVVVVSQNPDVKSIQLGIADFLDLDLKQDSLLARAILLHERLNQKKGSDGKFKRILVILDDLWKKLDLKEVGIRYPDDHIGCKIVFTSRSMEVCRQMKAQTFHIGVLPEEEAWSLFQNSLETTALYPIAKAIVTECGGLPIAITTIAVLLADKEENTWNDVLTQLQTSSLEGEYKKVYTVFHVSFANLESQETKDVFLLCCLFPEDSDISIEDIARYGMGLKVFKKRRNRHEERVSTRAHIEALKKLNLLLDSEEPESVKMHDLVRDFGISIASEGKFLVQFDSGLKEWPVEEIYEQCTHISMQCDSMNGLKYSNLKLLHLRATHDQMFEFPERLDEVMGGLQVLDLWHMSPLRLLGSVECLTNLRTLSLRVCALNNDVSSIGNIKQLEILSFAYSNISELPTEIGKLSWLRILDLTGCRKLHKITPGVLSGLGRLEEFYMGKASIRWAEEFSDTFDDDYASFGEVEQRLSNLVAIEIDIPYQFVPTNVNLEKVEKFKIIASDQQEYYDWEKSHGRGSQNSLLLMGKEIDRLKGLLKALCRKTKFLHVNVKDLKNLQNEVERDELMRLDILIFEECDDLVSVFDGTDQRFKARSSSVVLPPFLNLRKLAFTRCTKLKSVCSLSIASGLINLEELDISDCSSIEEIFSNEGGDDWREEKKVFEFLKLKKLHLQYLPNLVSFCKAVDDEVKLPQLKDVELASLPKLTSLYAEMKPSASSTNHPFFQQKVTHNNMAELRISNMDDLIELVPAQTADVSSTCGPRKVEVSNCGKLLRVFASNTSTQQLQCLESLNVYSCHSLEVVWDVQGITKTNEPTHVSRHIISQAFQNLKELDLGSCSRLKSIFSLSIARGLVMLEKLKVWSSLMMEEIFSKEAGKEDEVTSTSVACKLEFPKLKTLHLQNLTSLVSFCKSVDVIVAVPQLQHLHLQHLPVMVTAGLGSGMKTLVSNESVFDQKVVLMDKPRIFFPENFVHQLKNLEYFDLTELDSVEVVFDLQLFNHEEGHRLEALPRLQEVNLRRLPFLRYVCRNVPHQIRGFQNLHKLVVSWCDNLRHLLTTSMAKVLVGLKVLYVSNCEILESIVSEEKEAVESEIQQLEVLFPRLTNVELVCLPKLSTILPKAYTLKCLSLKAESVGDCVVGDIVKQVIVTDKLEVNKMDTMTTVFPANVIPQLQRAPKCIDITNCPNVEVVFDLEGSNLNEDHEVKAFSEVERVLLISLPKLTSVWKNGPRVIQSFQSLKELEVRDCDSLSRLFTLSMAKTLVSLHMIDIRNCGSLEAVVEQEEGEEDREEDEVTSTSVACKLEFPKLKTLHLQNLTSLVSFCKSVDVIVSVPELQNLRLPIMVTAGLGSGMKTLVSDESLFDQKVVLMDKPKNFFLHQLKNLEYFNLTEVDSVEVVFDLQLFNHEEGHGLEALPLLQVNLISLPNLRYVFRNVPHQIRGFQNLHKLVVSRCDNLRHLLTTSIAKVLVGLKVLYVSNCKILESIESEEKEAEESEIQQLVVLFPRLTNVRLDCLPKLSTILPKAYTLKCLSLIVESVGDCVVGDIVKQVIVTDKLEVNKMDTMTTVFPANVIPQLQRAPKRIDLTNCPNVEVVFDLEGSNLNEDHEVKAFSEVERVLLYSLPKLTSVWKNGPRVIQSFQSLKKLYVRNCDSLRRLFTLSMAKTLVSLHKLNIHNCGSLEAVVEQEEGEEDREEEEEATLFPKLVKLYLDELPSLNSIFPEPYRFFNYRSLARVRVDDDVKYLMKQIYGRK